MDTLRLAPNKPEVIALAFTSGKAVTSQLDGAEQIMFTLTNNARLYLDPPVARKIDSLNLGRGEPFEITLCVDRQKNKSYEVRYLANDAPQSAAAPMHAAPAPTARPETQPTTQRRVEAPLSGTASQVQQVPVQYSAPVPSSTGGALMGCFMSAIDAVAESQAYATRRGLGITFSADHVTSAALSAYINMQKGGR